MTPGAPARGTPLGARYAVDAALCAGGDAQSTCVNLEDPANAGLHKRIDYCFVHPLLASKAVYLAGLIGGDEAQPILNGAVEHSDPTVRVSAAASVQNLGDEQALELGRRLLDDDDLGVRKVAVNSAAQLESPEVRGELQKQAEADKDEAIRSLADRLRD
jgi:HEAT repeat protein